MIVHSTCRKTIAAMCIAALCAVAAHGEPLKVCVTVSDLASIVHQIGGEETEIVTFATGAEDAHFVDARPSFVKDLSRADLFVQIGLDLESAWAPVILRGSRNADVQPGARGFLDVSAAVDPIDRPVGATDRSQGDVHPRGNPHYLLDPVNGIRVARLIRDRLVELRPSSKAMFDARFERFRADLAAALVGDKLAETYDTEKLMILHNRGRLHGFLEQQGQSDWLSGWLGRLAAIHSQPVVADHNMWNYFAARFGLRILDYMEPKPGLAPTTKHLGALVHQMRKRSARVVIVSAYFDHRHADFLAKHASARVVTLAHQVDALSAATDYLAMFEHNVAALESAFTRD